MSIDRDIEIAARALVMYEGLDPDERFEDPILGLEEAWKIKAYAIKCIMERGKE